METDMEMEMEIEDGVLIITDSISVNARIVVWALQHFSIPLNDLRIITQASLLGSTLSLFLSFSPSFLPSFPPYSCTYIFMHLYLLSIKALEESTS